MVAMGGTHTQTQSKGSCVLGVGQVRTRCTCVLWCGAGVVETRRSDTEHTNNTRLSTQPAPRDS